MFRLLGFSSVTSLDHSDYEGAEIIHDLTTPVPPSLQDRFDFIVDGSTLDNVFDPATTLRNFSEMLRPGGRMLLASTFSNHDEPYVMIPPLWFLDYFVVNGFADCKTYILVVDKNKYNVFTINIDTLLDPERVVSAFASPYRMGILLLAEKQEASTSHVKPQQQHYRSRDQWQRYRNNLELIKASHRHHISRSVDDIFFFDVKAGHLFVDANYSALDPMTEILRLYPHYKPGLG